MEAVPKQTKWVNDVLPRYDDVRYKQTLRLTRADFKIVLDLIKDNSVFHLSPCQLSVEKQLQIALYRFGIYGTGASIPNVARLFGVGDGSTVVRVTRRVIQVRITLHPN